VLAWVGGGYSLDAGLRGAGGAIAASALGPLISREAQKYLNDAGLGNGSPVPGGLATIIGELALTGLAYPFGNMAALTAASVDLNNRQLHKAEKDAIAELAGDDPDKKHKLEAAACALVRCADGVPDDGSDAYKALRALQDYGATGGLAPERQLLQQQFESMPASQGCVDGGGGFCGSEKRPLFQYDAMDKAVDYCSTHSACIRGAGGLLFVGAEFGAASTATATAATCAQTAGATCYLGIAGTLVQLDLAHAGAYMALNGESKVPAGEAVLQSLGYTPGQAAALYGEIGMLAGLPAVIAKTTAGPALWPSLAKDVANLTGNAANYVERLFSAAEAAAPGSGRAIMDGGLGEIALGASRVPSEADVFDVFVHSNKHGFSVQAPADVWTPLSSSELFNAMEANGYAGQPVRLFACQTGACDATAAQNLANEIGEAWGSKVTVTAPTDKIWLQHGGNVVIGPSEQTNTGTWRTLTPQVAHP
jgi:hypothetical protein